MKCYQSAVTASVGATPREICRTSAARYLAGALRSGADTRPVRRPLVCGVLLVLLVLLAAAPGAFADGPDEIYREIKDQEKTLVPRPVGTAEVGTVTDRGAFDGLRTTTHYEASPLPGGKPVPVDTVPAAVVNGVRARLIWRFPHRGLRTVRVRATWRDDAGHVVRRVVRLGRRSKRVAVRINVDRAREVEWSLRASDGTSFSDRIRIERPRVVGAGAFTIEALPVAILYEPPQPVGAARRNTASLETTTETGSRITTSFEHGTGTRTTGTVPGFATAAELSRGAGALGGLLSAQDDPKAQAAGKALTVVSKAFGKAERTTDKSTYSVDEHALEVRMTNTARCQTAGGEGPGRGDSIYLLKGVRVMWLDDGIRTKLAILGADEAGCRSIHRMLEHLDARPRRRLDGMSATTVQNLIKLDPFVCPPRTARCPGPQALLSRSRFEKLEAIPADPYHVNQRELATSVGRDDSRARATSTVTTDDLSAGLLSVLGFGPTETKKQTLTVTLRSDVSFREQKTVRTAFSIQGPLRGTETVDVFYDRVFGTFAFQSHLPASNVFTRGHG